MQKMLLQAVNGAGKGKGGGGGQPKHNTFHKCDKCFNGEKML